MLIRLPRIARIACRRKRQQLGVVEANAARDNAARGRRHEAHDGERGDRLAASALAHHAERFATLERERYAVDRADHAIARVESASGGR
jgi:hypothetical protein